MSDDLTPLQARFCEEYIKDLNGAGAAERAGSKASDLYSAASTFLSNSKVQARIAELKRERSERTQIDAAWLLKRLADEATADVSDLYREDGSVKPVHEWPLIWRQGLVAGIKHQEVRDHEGNATGDVIVDIKVSDRTRRLELIGKHVNVQAFQENIQHKGLDALAERLGRAKKRGDDDEE